MKILGIIPARGGSQAIPRKNILPLCGVPLIGHIFGAASQVSELTDIVLSTDDEEIASVGRSLGISVPFMRPPELATDNATTQGAVKHAIESMESAKGCTYDIAVLLQPPCPLTQPDHIRAAIQHLIDNDLDSVGSATRLDDTHPAFVLERRGDHFERMFPELDGMTSRHDLKPLYRACGNVYAYRRHNPVEHGVLLGGRIDYVEIEKQFTVNINEPLDWVAAEVMIRHLQASNNS